MKKTIITALLALVAMTGQAQTPKDSCSIPKDSLRQERTAKSDTVNCPLDKLLLLKANVTNKEEGKSNLPKIALPKNDIYREKFMNLQLINIIGSHLSLENRIWPTAEPPHARESNPSITFLSLNRYLDEACNFLPRLLQQRR